MPHNLYLFSDLEPGGNVPLNPPHPPPHPPKADSKIAQAPGEDVMGPVGRLPLQEDKYRGILDTAVAPGPGEPRSLPFLALHPLTGQLQGQRLLAWPTHPGTCPNKPGLELEAGPRGHLAELAMRMGHLLYRGGVVVVVSKHFYKRHCPQAAPRRGESRRTPGWLPGGLARPSVLPSFPRRPRL